LEEYKAKLALAYKMFDDLNEILPELIKQAQEINVLINNHQINLSLLQVMSNLG
jgi:hypothetical protein